MESVLPISTRMPRTSLKKNDGQKTRRIGKCLPTRQLCIIRSSTIDEVVSVAQPTSSWQITIGALAGVTPFIIAGITFSQRIFRRVAWWAEYQHQAVPCKVAQKKCSVCKGSGLVQRDKYYFRCSNCGGFLPWQSWKRFFSG